VIPADFLAPAQSHHPLDEHHRILIANFLAQPQALMRGKTGDEVRAELGCTGPAARMKLTCWPRPKTFPGNRPTNLPVQKIQPGTLGRPHCPVRAQDFYPGRHLGHQLLDQMGGGAGQNPGPSPFCPKLTENPRNHPR